MRKKPSRLEDLWEAFTWINFLRLTLIIVCIRILSSSNSGKSPMQFVEETQTLSGTTQNVIPSNSLSHKLTEMINEETNESKKEEIFTPPTQTNRSDPEKEIVVEVRKKLLKYNFDNSFDPIPIFEIQKPILKLAADKIRNDFIFFMHINEAFTPFVKSWICNVRHMKNVLNITMIITDREGYKQLYEFDPTLNLIIYDAFIPKVNFGEVGYWRLNQHRVHILNYLVGELNKHLFVVEADAFWVTNPLNDPKIIDSSVDLVLFQDGPVFGFGFMGLVPTPKTKKTFQILQSQVDNSLKKHAAKKSPHSVHDESIPQEQIILGNIVKGKSFGGVKIQGIKHNLLDGCEYASGLWYHYNKYTARDPSLNKKYRKKCKNIDAKVINNNWIAEFNKKVDHAKYQNHWFVNDDDTCKDVPAYLKEFEKFLVKRKQIIDTEKV